MKKKKQQTVMLFFLKKININIFINFKINKKINFKLFSPDKLVNKPLLVIASFLSSGMLRIEL
jgi:hypothetical protein